MIYNFDHAILDFIQTLRCGFLDFVMPRFTELGYKGIFFILLGIVFLFFKKTRKSGIVILAALTLGALVCNLVLKPLVARPRPYTEIPDFVLLVSPLSDFSFPSGHTTAVFEAAFGVALLGKKAAIGAYSFAVLMAFSRMYLYVHYPTDVLAGAIIGTLSAVLVYTVYKAVENKRKTLTNFS